MAHEFDQKGVGHMNYIISGKNIDVTDGLKTAIYDKLGRLEKFFTEDTNVQVTFSVEKERQKIEVTIPMKGHIIRAEQSSDDMYATIDLIVEIIERQVTRYKKKILDKEQNATYIQDDFFNVADEDLEDEDVKIIRTKKFAVESMFPEDACIQMDLVGHDFYVFRNAETDKINVVYKRKGNTYGLIEPEF